MNRFGRYQLERQILSGIRTHKEEAPFHGARQLDVTATPSIITIGSIDGGVRGNIIPERVEMTGTI